MSDPPQIRTPDQRVRVFVSSTLQELAPERAVARTAIERLHLAPVMFELGARPHPPRELYRAYLAQSQIFIGVYGERYGWVAPGESVSGLEDEYALSAGIPRLIYVKATSDTRDERLEQLLDRIRDDDTASYRSFSSVDELAMLVEDDLALMMSERFEPPQGAGDSDSPSPAAPRVPLTALLGREQEVATIRDLLTTPGVRLVTLVGSGGSGKTRIALELLNDVAPTFVDGVWFVDLSAVREPDDVLVTIAQTLGVRELPGTPMGERLARVLVDRKALVVLDNFEQVLAAGVHVVSLLQATRGLSVLVTSRSPLRVGGERTVDVGPLPEEAAGALFTERTRAVRPDFAGAPGEAATITEICRRLDRLPLAIELAAARMRPLSASGLLQRIGRTLPELDRGPRDLPARQRTLRDTIAWSVDLLSPSAAEMFARLAAFTGACDLEAILAVCGADQNDVAALAHLEELVDASLVREEEVADGLIFSMLMTVREFALEVLESSGEAEALRRHHDDYFLQLAEDSRLPGDVGSDVHAYRRLQLLQGELWAAGDRFAAEGETEKLARLSWGLLLMAWVGSQLPQLLDWVETCLRHPDALSPRARARVAAIADSAIAGSGRLQDQTRLAAQADLLHDLDDLQGEAFARTMISWSSLSQTPPDLEGATRELLTAYDLAARAGDILTKEMTQLTLGQLALGQGDLDAARTQFESSYAEALSAGYEAALIVVLDQLSWVDMAQGHVDEGRDKLAQAFALSVRLGHQEGIAHGLERLGALAASDGDVVRSARLLGAGRRRREISGRFTFAAVGDYFPVLSAALGEERARAEVDAGMRMGPDEAIGYAQAQARHE
jgi:predicted ATPase